MKLDELKAQLKETPEWIAFHKPKDKGGWGLPRKPYVAYVILNKLLNEEKYLTVKDIQALLWWMRHTWDEPRYRNFQTRISHARIELRHIVGDRCRKYAEKQKLVDREGAKRLRDRMHDLIGTEG